MMPTLPWFTHCLRLIRPVKTTGAAAAPQTTSALLLLLLFWQSQVYAQNSSTNPALEQAITAAEQLYATDAVAGKKAFAALKGLNPDDDYLIKQRLCWTQAPAEPTTAIALINTIKNQAENIPELWQLRFSLCQAYAEEQLGNNQQALSLYQQILANPLAATDQVMYARALTLRGEQYAMSGAYPQALEDLKQAYQLEQQLGNAPNLSYVSNALANLYADPALADYKEAVALYQQTLLYHRQQKNQQDEATALYNLGSTYESMGELEQALNYLQQALMVEEQRAQPEDIAFNKRAIARVLTKTGKANEAIKLLNEAIVYYQKSSNSEHMAFASSAVQLVIWR